LPYMEKEKDGSASKAGKILMATVKGDVHDIGKNIVGVVMQCNGFEVIDLGVMVPTDKILNTAIELGVQAIGLSGLITPSLEEMIGVAQEMERRGMKLPLLIGGATTSRVHTAVKIAPHYSGAVVHVVDASKSVPAATSLLSDTLAIDYAAAIRKEYDELREGYQSRSSAKDYLPIEAARKNRFAIEWDLGDIQKPKQLGIYDFSDYSLEELSAYIDWTPFFQAWELHGRFPRILEDAVVGVEATKLYADAKAMLQRIIDEKWVTAKAAYGLFPASAIGDDIEVYADESRQTVLTTLCSLRQQGKKGPGIPNLCLTDFIAPKDSGVADYVGAFVVTAGNGIEAQVAQFEKENDDYSAIMLKALADRLAEAFAERLHERVRKEFWGYAVEETLENDALIAEKYRGIRPAPGYPACPDHTEKTKLFALLDAERRTGVTLTESLAMHPASSVSGWYFAHPQSRYFGLGKITEDQLTDYAARKSMDLGAARKWLAPNLVD